MDAAFPPTTSKSLNGLILAASCVGSCSAVKPTSVFLYQALEASAEIGDGHDSGVIHHLWWVGALTTMVGATLTILGLMIQKTAHGCRTADQAQTYYYWKSWRWILGLLVWLGGQAICWTADGLANRSLLACFNCWNIVVVFVISPWYLGEKVHRAASVGATITLCGCIWMVLAGPKSYQSQTVAKLQDSWLCLPCLFLFLGSFVLALCLAGLRVAKRSMGSAHLQLAALSAIFAWYAVLFSKCASMLAVTSVLSWSQFGHWQFWAYLAFMVAFAVCQVHTLNMALTLSTAVEVLPAYESLSMMGQVVICGVFFEEFRDFEANGYISFSCAIICILVGITIMSGAASLNFIPQDPMVAFDDARTSLTSPSCRQRTSSC